MATVYETGSAIDAVDLHDKLHTFLASNGYTINHYQSAGDYNAGYQLAAEKNGCHILMRSFIGYWNNSPSTTSPYEGIICRPARSYVPNASSQFGADYDSTIHTYYGIQLLTQGPVLSYHFISYENPNALVVVVEYQANRFSHMVFGELDSYMDPAPMYITGTSIDYWYRNSSSSTYYNYTYSDTNSGNKRMPFNTRNQTATSANMTVWLSHDEYEGYSFYDGQLGTTYKRVTSSLCGKHDVYSSVPSYANYTSDTTKYGMMWKGVNTDFSMKPLAANYLYAEYGNKYSYIGKAPGIMAINSTGFVGKEILDYGTDQYIVLPIWKSDWGTLSPNYSFNTCMAYKIN